VQEALVELKAQGEEVPGFQVEAKHSLFLTV
jgi:hypothetical protein